MKKHILVTLLFSLCANILLAQQRVVVTLSNGTRQYLRVDEVDSITFAEVVTPKDAPVAESVDLGLNVKWASHNIGASKETEAGFLVGFGDSSGLLTSTILEDYPLPSSSVVGNNNIIGTDCDLATSLWGGEWRMPSDEDFEELIEKCEWQWTVSDGVAGYRVTGPNGNFIFLPITGIREQNLVKDYLTTGYYWSGMFNGQDGQPAFHYQFANADKRIYTCIQRYMGLAVRAVYGEYRPKLNIGATTVSSSVTTTAATLEVTMSGNTQDVAEYGIIYGVSESLDINNGTKVALDGESQQKIQNLSRGTTYYYRAYAYYLGKYEYSDIKSFTTKASYPVTVEAADATQIQTTSAKVSMTVSGTIIEIDEIGIVYGKERNVTIENGQKLSHARDTEASFEISDLEHGTTYYYRAYVINGGEYEYSDIKSFTTLAAYEVTVSTLDYTDLKTTSVRVGMSILGTLTEVSEYGVIYGTTALIDSNNGQKLVSSQSESTNWLDLTGLAHGTTYYYRAYVVNNGQYVYGDVKTLTTLAKYTVAITTGEASDVKTTTATISMTISGELAEVSEYGVIYNTGATVDASHGTAQKGTLQNGKVQIGLSNLQPGTTYYYRAYAINNGQYEYSDIRSFVTPASVIITASNETPGASSVHIQVNYSGGESSRISEYGLIYGINETLDATHGTKEVLASAPANGQARFDLVNLTPDYVYFYVGYVIYNGEYVFSERQAFRTERDYRRASAIDLGLPSGTLWADFNIGADEEQQAGLLVGWGDVSGTNHSKELSEYAGSYPDANISGSANDIATKMWGGNWRMPTPKDILELIDGCTFKWGESNGVKGYVVTSKSNSNRIFIPVTGMRDGESVSGESTTGNYWTGALYASDAQKAQVYQISSNAYNAINAAMRYMGCAIRPVYGKQGITLAVGDATNVTEGAATITIQMSGDGSQVTEYGIEYGTSTSALTSKVKATSTSVTINGLNQQTTYYYRAYAIVNGQTETTSIKSFTTSKATVVPEQVDLGLTSGIRWASFNYGATKSDEVGTLVGWGDTSGTLTTTTLDNYPVATPLGDITNSRFDIAQQKWGDKWRLPSEEEFKELLSECDWNWETSATGVSGYRVTSKADASKSIFLPVTGKREGTATSDNAKGFYWTGNLNSSDNSQAKAAEFSSGATPSDLSVLKRYMGLAVRPVYGDYGSTASVTASIQSVSSSTAILGIRMNGDLKNITAYGVDYGLTESLGQTVSVGSAAPDFGIGSATLSGLNPEKTYYYQAYIVYKGTKITSSKGSFTTELKFVRADAVDLGLDVKWASWDLGASKIESFGEYFAWADPDGDGISNYWADYNAGKAPKDISGTAYDIVTTQWGDDWRMPTRSEIDALLSLEREWITNYNGSGINGYLVHGKGTASGNTIFLPASGYMGAGRSTAGQNSYPYYWTSESPEAGKVAVVMILPTYAQSYTIETSVALCIRPVKGAKSGGTSSETPLTAEGKNKKYVDLGLSVKWATTNIGADSEYLDGEYFAWGETTTKDTYKKENNIGWSESAGKYEDTIGHEICSTEYDAAHVRWGGTWRLPSRDEIDELKTQCTWEWQGSYYGYKVTGPNGNSIFLPASGYMEERTLYNNMNGGYYWSGTIDTSLKSLSGSERNIDKAYMLSFSNSTHSSFSSARSVGRTIRPVCP